MCRLVGSAMLKLPLVCRLGGLVMTGVLGFRGGPGWDVLRRVGADSMGQMASFCTVGIL